MDPLILNAADIRVSPATFPCDQQSLRTLLALANIDAGPGIAFGDAGWRPGDTYSAGFTFVELRCVGGG